MVRVSVCWRLAGHRVVRSHTLGVMSRVPTLAVEAEAHGSKTCADGKATRPRRSNRARQGGTSAHSYGEQPSAAWF